MGLLQAEIRLRIIEGIKAGIGSTRLYWKLRAVGPVTRKTDFLAVYRKEARTKKMEGLLRFVRKDRYPTTTIMSALSPEASKEFLYKLRYSDVIKPVREEDYKFVNIMSDVPMTPEMIEAEVIERWGEFEKYRPEAVTELQVWSVFRKSIE